jgi:hypothetical protein
LGELDGDGDLDAFLADAGSADIQRSGLPNDGGRHC